MKKALIGLILLVAFAANSCATQSRDLQYSAIGAGIGMIMDKGKPGPFTYGLALLGFGIGNYQDQNRKEKKLEPYNKVEIGEYTLEGKVQVPNKDSWIKGARILVSVDSYGGYSRNELIRTAVEGALKAKGAVIIASTSKRRYSDEDEGLGATHIAHVITQRDRDYAVVVVRVINKTNNEVAATGTGRAYAYYHNDDNYSVATQNAISDLH